MATDLSWDAFAAPPPELAGWQPNPDLIPVSGVLPDMRFNKEPLTAQQKKALKRDKLLGLYLDDSGQSFRAGSPATSTGHIDTPKNVGSWPAPAPRVTGLPSTLTPARDQRPLVSLTEPLRPVDTLTAAPKRASAPGSKPTSFLEPSNGSKGTIETLPVHPLFERPHTPPIDLRSQASESPPTTPTPSWARKFVHLLGDLPPMESGLPVAPRGQTPLPPPAQVGSLSSVSKPPHLRKQPHSSISTTPVVSREAFFNSSDVAGAPQNKLQSTYPLNVVPSSSSSRLCSLSDVANSDTTSADDVSSLDVTKTYANANTTQKIMVQKRLLSSFIPKKASLPSIDHERYLKGKLISALEEEMDMPQRTTRRELHKMIDAELDSHLTKTKALHKISWESRQKRDNTGEMGDRSSLVAFEENERERSRRDDGSLGPLC